MENNATHVEPLAHTLHPVDHKVHLENIASCETNIKPHAGRSAVVAFVNGITNACGAIVSLKRSVFRQAFAKKRVWFKVINRKSNAPAHYVALSADKPEIIQLPLEKTPLLISPEGYPIIENGQSRVNMQSRLFLLSMDHTACRPN